MLVLCANPSCGTKFPRPDTDAGRIVSCPQCGKSTAAKPASAEKKELGQLGDYKLLRAVAKGGMGEVFEATQLRLGRSVALKVLNKQLAADAQFLNRFEREAKSAAALNHPNIVHVYDFAHEDGQAYLVMEFIEGQDLAKIVSQTGKMPLKDSLRITADVASALQEAHSKGIIHRDIKPANILLTPKGVVKVSDLGLARKMDEDSDLTVTGAGMGTPHFMSPEQARDAHHVDHRADIYSLGITLLYLLTGKRPFEGKSSYSIVLAHSTEPLPSGLELGTELPPHVEALLQKMAAKKTEDRYSDYSTLLADIRRVQRGEMPEGKLDEATSAAPIAAPAAAAVKPVAPKPLEITATVPGVNQQGTMAPLTQPGESRVWLMAMVAGIFITAVISLVALVHSLKDKGNSEPQQNAVTQPPSPDSEDPSQPPRRELSQQDYAAIQEMLNQPKGQRMMGPNGMNGPNERPDPLTQLPQAGRQLKEGPLADMLAECEAYAKANPEKYRSILMRYDQLHITAAGSPYQKQVDDARDEWQKRQMEAVKKYYEKFLLEVKNVIATQGHRIGMQQWKNFPEELRGPEPDMYLRDKIQEDLPPPNVGTDGLRNGLGPRGAKTGPLRQ